MQLTAHNLVAVVTESCEIVITNNPGRQYGLALFDRVRQLYGVSVPAYPVSSAVLELHDVNMSMQA